MKAPECSTLDCDLPATIRGYCRNHYAYLHYHGILPNLPIPDWRERFWEKVNKTESCWLWTGGLGENGYGLFWLKPLTVRAHRISWTLTFGEIPDGLYMDHLCRVRNCVRPDHLEPVTPAVNLARSQNPTWKTHITGTCQRGHSMADGYIHKDGGIRCRTCVLERTRIRDLKLRDLRILAKSTNCEGERT